MAQGKAMGNIGLCGKSIVGEARAAGGEITGICTKRSGAIIRWREQFVLGSRS
jgi:hypothetical protein